MIFAGYREQLVAQFGWSQEVNLTGRSETLIVVGVAGEGKRRVGECKDQATVADVQAIDHVITN